MVHSGHPGANGDDTSWGATDEYSPHPRGTDGSEELEQLCDRRSRFEDDLLGLDPHDPEVQAFAAHLDRMERSRANYTVEGYLAGVADFADSANRATGHRRVAAVVVVGLLLLGVLVALWSALAAMLT